MKAQFVYENMRFERGVDPKSAMGIGIVEDIKRRFLELQKHIGFMNLVLLNNNKPFVKIHTIILQHSDKLRITQYIDDFLGEPYFDPIDEFSYRSASGPFIYVSPKEEFIKQIEEGFNKAFHSHQTFKSGDYI